MIQAICKEIDLQKNYLNTTSLETIYFGGGTPSLLTAKDLNLILDTVSSHFSLSTEAEITLEANPDDLSTEKIMQLRYTAINRLSIGIQSFYEPHLQYMHRAHTATDSEMCIKNVQDAGFENLTVDLIYGIPHPDHSVWERDLQKVIQLNIPHLSAYCLTIEPQTVFGKWVKQKKIVPVDEEFSAIQFEMMLSELEKAGFEQYEISNFAKNSYYARHNSGYWLQKPYLGIGPSAHSFNGDTRQFNVANNAQYIRRLTQNSIPCTIETLTRNEQINDYLLTSLRTRWGSDIKYMHQKWGYDLPRIHPSAFQLYQESGLIALESGILKLTQKGKLLADEITSTFFVID